MSLILISCVTFIKLMFNFLVNFYDILVTTGVENL